VPPGFTIFFLLVCGLFAMAAGALAGVLASFFLRLPIRGVWKDAVLGLLGFFLVFFAPILVSRLGPLLINTQTGSIKLGFSPRARALFSGAA
jgi:hypothetical protein